MAKKVNKIQQKFLPEQKLKARSICLRVSGLGTTREREKEMKIREN
jgi:hypothetical protein